MRKINIEKGLNHLKKVDRKMARLIKEFEKPEFRKESNYFEALVRIIVYQQLSGKAASTIYKRFKELFSATKYPSPQDVLFKTHEQLRAVGLSNQKAAYIHNIASAFNSGAVTQNIDSLQDEEIIEKLNKSELAGAILDVFTHEPIESNSKLWNTPNLVITPHVSSDDHGSYVKMTLDLFFKNLKLFISNKELLNQINKDLGY